MPFGADAELLGDLPLKQVDLGAIGSQGGKRIRLQRGCHHMELAGAAVGKHCVQFDSAIWLWGVAEERSDSATALHGLHDGPPEVREGTARNLCAAQDLSTAQRGKAGARFHGFASRKVAASRSSASSGS